MSSGNTLAEYLVSLGVKVDEAGFRKVQNTLFSTKATILGISAALVAMTVGIAKASQSLTDSQQKFEDMAKAGKKSAESIAQQEIALKAMGKTLSEINKNERLKKTFKELKDIGKSIGMPTAGAGRQQVQGLMAELEKLKVTSTYALHHINNVFLEKLAGPLSMIKDDLEDLRKKIMLNMPKISQVVGGFLSKFLQVMLNTGRSVKDLIGWINDLPVAIKILVGAFAGMWGVMKASPIFWLLGGLMSLMLLLDDFQIYKKGGKSALGDIWEMFATEGVTGTIKKGLETVDFSNAGDIAGGFLKDMYTWLFGEINKIVSSDTLTGWVGTLDKVTKSVVGFIVGAFEGFDIGEFANQAAETIGGIVNSLLDVVFGSEAVIETDGREFRVLKEGNPGLLKIGLNIVKSLSDSIVEQVSGADWTITGAEIGKMFTGFFTKIGDFFANLGEGDNIFASLVDVAASIANGLVDALTGFLETADPKEVSGAISSFFNKMWEMLSNAFKGESGTGIELVGLGEKIGTAIGDAIRFTGNLFLDLAKKLDEDFESGGAAAEFFSIGLKIAQGILLGIYEGVNDVLGIAIFGGDEWGKYKEASKIAERVSSGEMILKDSKGNVITDPNKATSYAMEHPNEARVQSESQEGWAGQQKAIDASFGGRYKDPTYWEYGQPYLDASSYKYQYGLYDYRFKDEHGVEDKEGKKIRDERVNAVLSAQKSQDPAAYEKAMISLLNFVEGFKNGKGLRGVDLGAYESEGLATKLGIDLSGLPQEIKTAIGTSPYPINLKPVFPEGAINPMTGNPFGSNAAGGRYNTPQMTTISETGQTEYVIPMDRPERAKGLILQMLSEMGSGAKDILNTFGATGGGGGEFGGISQRLAMAGAYPSGGGGSVKSNSDNTVTSNPVINVYGSSDPVMTGKVVYQASEQTLMRHVRGVLGS